MSDLSMPKIVWASDPVQPDETVVLLGGDFNKDVLLEVGRLEDELEMSPRMESTPQVKNWQKVEPFQISQNSVKFVIPREWEIGVFACRVKCGKVFSDTVMLNSPDVWWMQGDGGEAASPGGWLRVFGKSLSFNNSKSTVLLRSKDGKTIPLTAKEFTCYALEFEIPPELEPGDYTVLVHNGFGGDSAWTEAGSMSFKVSEKWPQDVFNVKEHGIDKALELAGKNGGGVIYFPFGRYKMNGQITVPHRTVLKGEGTQLVGIYWPDMEEPPPALVTGTTYAVEDLTIYCQNHFNHVIEAAGDRFTIRRVRIRANPLFRFGREGKGQEWRERVLNCTIRETGCALYLKNVKNFEITECDILIGHKGISFFNARNGLISRNKIRYGYCGIALENIDCVIVEENEIEGGDLTASGNNFTSYNGNYSQNLYYARNQHKHTYGVDRELFTFDAAGGAYFGKLMKVEGQYLTLAGDPNPRTYSKTPRVDWTGAVVCIMDGKGLGQYRRVMSNNGRIWKIDRGWDIEPDGTSIISIVPFRGRILFVENSAEDAGVTAAFGSSIDCIFASNRLSRTSGMIIWGCNPHDWGWQPAWFCQFLNNEIIEGTAWDGFVEKQPFSPCSMIAAYASNIESGIGAKDFDGLITCCPIMRHNVIHNNGKFMIMGTTANAIVERCTVRNSDRGIEVGPKTENVLLRENTFENVITQFYGDGIDNALVLPSTK